VPQCIFGDGDLGTTYVSGRYSLLELAKEFHPCLFEERVCALKWLNLGVLCLLLNYGRFLVHLFQSFLRRREIQVSQPLPQPYLHSSSRTASTSNTPWSSWLPFTLQWYYLILPISISLCLGSVLVYLTLYSTRHHGIGPDDGSSAILFGWRFTPTLCAILYAQMTVILFEDVKRTEPFARLAKAPPGGASAYGTLLQTPRAWWSIFFDVCFRRKRVGKTSWALICTACVNVIALLVISLLSSALLTSEEILIPRSMDFTRIVPKANLQVPAPTRDT
jgi:hypothetical protein